MEAAPLELLSQHDDERHRHHHHQRHQQQQHELQLQLGGALATRMDLLGASRDESAFVGGCFRHADVTPEERAAKGLAGELPSELELETVRLIEGDVEFAAADADAEELRRWLEHQPELLSQLLAGVAAEATGEQH